MGRAKDSALGLALRVIDHPLTQRHLEEDPQDHRHEEATRELGRQELPTQQDEQDETQLEHQVGRGELEDDRVDEAGPPSEEGPGYGHRGVRAGRARRAEAARQHEAFQVGPAQRVRNRPLRNDGLDHG